MESVDNHKRDGTDPQNEPKKKVYRSPKLIEYGDIEKLTLGDAGPLVDIPGSRTNVR